MIHINSIPSDQTTISINPTKHSTKIQTLSNGLKFSRNNNQKRLKLSNSKAAKLDQRIEKHKDLTSNDSEKSSTNSGIHSFRDTHLSSHKLSNGQWPLRLAVTRTRTRPRPRPGAFLRGLESESFLDFTSCGGSDGSL